MNKIKNKEEVRIFIIENLGVDVFKNTEKRDRNLAEARALFFKIIKETNKNTSLKDIGDLLGKTHATVIHNIRLYDDSLCEYYEPYLNAFLGGFNAPFVEDNRKHHLANKIISKLIKIDDKYKLTIIEKEFDNIFAMYIN